jgi:hypothetical protein
LGLAESLAVHPDDGLSDFLFFGIVREAAVGGSVKVVNLTVLVEEPRNL